MIRKNLTKLYNKMLIKTTSSNKFYEKFIRWQVINILEVYLFKNKSINIFKYIYSFRILIISITLLILTIIFTYNRGRSSKDIEINNLENIINNYNIDKLRLRNNIRYLSNIIEYKIFLIDRISKFKKSREWIEFNIQKDANIDDFKLNMSRISDDIFFLMVDQADKYKIPYTIYFRLIDKESGFRFIKNYEGSGAFGYMQIMPYTFKSYSKILNLNGEHNEVNNILVGSYMLYKNYNDWLDRGMNDYNAWRYCLSEYNTGEKNMTIRRHGKKSYYIPNFTKSYINYIMKYYR